MRFVTPEAADAAELAVAHCNSDDSRTIGIEALKAAETEIAGAVMEDFAKAFKHSAVEAGLSTLLLHHFSQIIENYRKAVTSV